MFPKIEKTDKKIAIWMHSGPDPDAIGSALGLAWLLKKEKGMECEVFHTGFVSHPENRSLMNVLNLSFKGPEEYFRDKDNYEYVAVVDGTVKNVGVDLEHVDIIVDHHRAKINKEDYKFVLNEQVGACSSLVYKLIKESPHEFTADDEIIATSLLFGVITDTNNLLSETVTDLDFEAFAYLRNFANLNYVQEIKSYPIPSYFFDYEAVASDEENKVEANGTLISFLGLISPQRRDVLPYIADRLMRKEATDTTVIMAVIDNHLEASIRSKKVSLDVNEFVQKIFGDEYSGGKRGAAAAKVPMGLFRIPEDDNNLKDEIIEVTKNMLIAKIRKEIIKDG